MNDSAERIAVIRREFPVLDGRASVDKYIHEYFPLRTELRAGFAGLLGATPDEIAITHHTTEGMSIAVWGLNWQRGDEIVGWGWIFARSRTMTQRCHELLADFTDDNDLDQLRDGLLALVDG